MKKSASCACGAAPKLIFPCSGGADVGELSDRAARKLTQEGAGKMYCLAGIGGRAESIMNVTRAATAVLAINGCPLDCASRTLAEAGFRNHAQIRVTDLGLKKGESPADAARIEIVAARGRAVLEASA